MRGVVGGGGVVTKPGNRTKYTCTHFEHNGCRHVILKVTNIDTLIATNQRVHISPSVTNIDTLATAQRGHSSLSVHGLHFLFRMQLSFLWMQL